MKQRNQTKRINLIPMLWKGNKWTVGTFGLLKIFKQNCGRVKLYSVIPIYTSQREKPIYFKRQNHNVTWDNEHYHILKSCCSWPLPKWAENIFFLCVLVNSYLFIITAVGMWSSVLAVTLCLSTSTLLHLNSLYIKNLLLSAGRRKPNGVWILPHFLNYLVLLNRMNESEVKSCRK